MRICRTEKYFECVWIDSDEQERVTTLPTKYLNQFNCCAAFREDICKKIVASWRENNEKNN